MQSRGRRGLDRHLRVRQGARGQQAAQGGWGQDLRPGAQGERHYRVMVTFPEVISHSYIFHLVYVYFTRVSAADIYLIFLVLVTRELQKRENYNFICKF